MALIAGVNSASGCYACIWCKCPAKQQYDTSQILSLIDVNSGAQTVEYTIKVAKLPQSTCNFWGPVFERIPLHHVVIDYLYLFLHVTDTFIDLIILELR